MKKTPRPWAILTALLMVTLTPLSACQKKKASDTEVSPSPQSTPRNIDPCEETSTPPDEASYVIERRGFDINYNIYWMGASETVLSFWTDKGSNSHFEIRRAPLAIYFHYYQNYSKENLSCFDNAENAQDCLSAMNETLLHLTKTLEGSLNKNRRKILSCSRSFLEKKTLELEVFLRKS